MSAMRGDDFNTILELKMKGYQPSETLLKTLQPELSSTTFIAVAKIFGMDEMLKCIQDIGPSRAMGGNKQDMGMDF